jgi:hypothetical protein
MPTLTRMPKMCIALTIKGVFFSQERKTNFYESITQLLIMTKAFSQICTPYLNMVAVYLT